MSGGLLTEAMERRKEIISKQFISFYDSVLYLGGADKSLNFVVDRLFEKQTHLRLRNDALYLVTPDQELSPTKGGYEKGFYMDYQGRFDCFFDASEIKRQLKTCIKKGFIDEESPIYNLGFAKKSFFEMLSSYGVNVPEDDLNNAQSPDLTFDDELIEVDYHTFSMIDADREKLKEKVDQLQKEKKELKEKLGRQGYLDPENKSYSVEMKLGHDTWNHLYGSGTPLVTSHSTQVDNYLKNYPDFEVNNKAIERIKTVTYPKSYLATSKHDT